MAWRLHPSGAQLDAEMVLVDEGAGARGHTPNCRNRHVFYVYARNLHRVVATACAIRVWLNDGCSDEVDVFWAGLAHTEYIYHQHDFISMLLP